MSDTKLDVRVYPIGEPKGSTMAFANVTVDDLAVIRGVRVVDSDKGLFVSMPQSQDKTGEYHDIAFPLTADLRKDITAAVVDEYNRMAELAPNRRGYDAPDMSAANAKNAAAVKLDIRVYPLDEPKSGTKAFASVSLDDVIAIRCVRVVAGEKGMFAAMPQTKDKDGEYHDIAFPLSANLRKAINKAVVKEYKEAVKAPKKSLADSLKKGAEKAAGHDAQKNTAAKSRAGAIE